MGYCLLTGATSGIGKKIADRLSESYDLIVSGRDMEKLEDLRQSLNGRCSCVIWKFDLSKPESLEKELTDWLMENHLEVIGYVHCAGIVRMIPIKMISYEYICQIYNINVFSASIITKVLASRRINKNNLKSVVYISSNSSQRGVKSFSLYSSSKAALDGLMRNFAMELGPRMRINSVLPGGIHTEGSKMHAIRDDVEGAGENRTPLGRGCADDIADTVEFLLSSKARWITGQQIVVDGGRSINITE